MTGFKLRQTGQELQTLIDEIAPMKEQIGQLLEGSGNISPELSNALETIAKELAKKVDKVDGKQLSTEDFTTALKAKLEGMSSFDPTEINNRVNGLQSQFDTLVSGDASAAIESFNEIIAFLDGVKDSESLDGIIAGIGHQIAMKQDKLISGENLKTVNGESLLGQGNILIPIYSPPGTPDTGVPSQDVEGFIPLSRDFSDDFNNDFTR